MDFPKNLRNSRLLLVSSYLIVLLAALLIFSPSLKYYFFQDDWFVLNRLDYENIKSFFLFRNDVIYYRPVGMQLFFLISNKIFGLNSFAFHSVSFLFHLLNTVLISSIVFKVFKNRLAALSGSFIYAVAAFHYMSLSWLALTWNVIGAFFVLSAIFFYLTYINNKKNFSLAVILITYMLAFASTEFAIVLPIILPLISIFYFERSLKEILRRDLILNLLTLSIAFLHLIARFIIFPISTTAEYSFNFSPINFTKTLFWYLLWLFNLPDELKYQIVISKFMFTKIILRDVGSYLLPLIISFGLLIVFLILLIQRGKLRVRNFVPPLIIFVIFLTPVLFLPQHSYTYYLTLPSLGLVFLWANLLKNLKQTTVNFVLISLFLYSWFISSLVSVSINRDIHWVHKQQDSSKNAISDTINKYPSLPDGAQIGLESYNTMLKNSLFDQDAMQVIYKNKTIKTFYFLDDIKTGREQYYLVNLKD